jgi:hypothetical protein
VVEMRDVGGVECDGQPGRFAALMETGLWWQVVDMM